MEVLMKTYGCDELMYEYELVRSDDGTYYVYVALGPLRGLTVAHGIDTIDEAFEIFYNTVKEKEAI